MKKAKGMTCLVPRPRYFRFQSFTSGKSVSGTSPKRVVTSQRIEREGLGKTRTGTRQRHDHKSLELAGYKK